LLIKYLILPDISPSRLCETILTVRTVEQVGLLSGLPPLTDPDKESLTEKINKYYDKCGQIERQQKVHALNADRKEITLSAVCAVPKKKSDASKVSKKFVEKFVEKFQSAIAEAEATVEKETKVVKPSSTKKLKSSPGSASPEPEKSSLTPEQQTNIDAAIETEAAAGVVSQLLQNLLVPKPKRTKKSKQDAIATTAATATTATTNTSAATAKAVTRIFKAKRTPQPDARSQPFVAAASPAQIGAPVQSALFAASSQPFVATSPFSSLPQAPFGAPSVPSFPPAATLQPSFPPQAPFLSVATSPFSSLPQAPFGAPSVPSFPSVAPSQQFQFSASAAQIVTPTPAQPAPAPASQALPSASEPAQSASLTSPARQPPVGVASNSEPVLSSPELTTKLAEQSTQESQKKTKARYFSEVDNNGPISARIDKTFNEELRNEERKVKSRTEGLSTEGGGSPTFSIPTPSKTRKSHQGKRSHSSNKSTFKRRKYTEE
jgi:hypothetical protein